MEIVATVREVRLQWKLTFILFGVAAIVIAAAIGATAFAVWLYRFINPDRDVLMLLAAWAALHGLLMLIRDTRSRQKLVRLRWWLGGTGFMVIGCTLFGVAMKINSTIGANSEQFLVSLPMFLRLLGGFVYLVGMSACFLVVVCMLIVHLAKIIGSWSNDDHEFSLV